MPKHAPYIVDSDVRVISLVSTTAGSLVMFAAGIWGGVAVEPVATRGLQVLIAISVFICAMHVGWMCFVTVYILEDMKRLCLGLLLPLAVHIWQLLAYTVVSSRALIASRLAASVVVIICSLLWLVAGNICLYLILIVEQCDPVAPEPLSSPGSPGSVSSRSSLGDAAAEARALMQEVAYPDVEGGSGPVRHQPLVIQVQPPGTLA